MPLTINLTGCAPVVTPPLCIEMGYGGLYCLPTSTPGLLEARLALKDLLVGLNPYIPVIKVLQVGADSGLVLKSIIRLIPGLSFIPGLDDAPDPASAVATLLADLGAVIEMANPPVAFGVTTLHQVQVLRAFLVALRARIAKYIADYARIDLKMVKAANNPARLASLACSRRNVDAEILRLQGELAGAAVFLRLLNSVSCLAFGKKLAPLPALGSNLQAFLAPLDVAIALVDEFLQLVPLPSLPLKDAC